MNRKAYAGGENLHRALRALMQWSNQVKEYNHVHKGDIGHRMFNGGLARGYDPSNIFYYWEDDSGEIIAFASIYGWWDSFDLQVAPEYRFTDSHKAIFQWCEQATIDFAKRIGNTPKELVFEVCDDDTKYKDFVTALGYTDSKLALELTEHDLKSFPDAPMPAGFTIRLATSDDLENMADVHNHSFTNKWNAELYGKVFHAPHMEREFIVVAPDGRFAAFTNIWHDDINHSILFEPVGTHSDFRRKGIGKAMMVHVMKTMQAEHNIERAYVCHEPPDKNIASGKLYASIGFKVKYHIHECAKSVTIS
jgi:GNAT superfamily N-acetyltransferase